MYKRQPYISFLGVVFERADDQIKAILPFKDELIGNPSLPALHGGSIAAFLEISAIVELSWMQIRRQIEAEENVTDFLADFRPFFFLKPLIFLLIIYEVACLQTHTLMLQSIERVDATHQYMSKLGRIIAINCLLKQLDTS